MTPTPNPVPAPALTLPQRLLLAASDLDCGNIPFTIQTLTVTAWRRWPDVFGLAGFEAQFPDHNRVVACVVGKKRLAARGLLVKVQPYQYALTCEGRDRVRELTGQAARKRKAVSA